uniref:Pc21g00130 putative n=1 Tax=Albugo laibachii Nc14 TaxID=890382 RepID=F0WLQ5_9STRA|nr:Pc21g00130 putative [Albugo laibachii Nc14]|eukprot:CCA22227.1 Pc21g00130 putative [Albugo laibachii Nc14]
MANAGVKPNAVLSALRMTKSDTFANLRTIYNARVNMPNKQLAGRAPLESYLDNLQESDWVHHVEANEVGNITGLFFAYPESIKLANQYNYVVVMDCTYKGSRLRMPLLHIIGMTAFNTTFIVGFCFLAMEKLENYLWAMSKLSTVWENGSAPKVIVKYRELAYMKATEQIFPSSSNFTCLWHINKNILANCKQYYANQEDFDAFMQMWNVLVSSSREKDFEDQLANFADSLSEKLEALKYVMTSWLVYKKQFLESWTLNHPHFGDKSSEGAHAYV